MIVRYLPALLILVALVLALAPLEAAAQSELGPGIRTEMTPLDRETHNGVFDHLKHAFGLGDRKPTIDVGEVKPVQVLTAEQAAAQAPSTQGPIVQARPYSTDPPPPDRKRPKSGGAPVNTDSENKAIPPGTDVRKVRPAEAFPPERIEKTPQAPSRAGVDTPPGAPKDDPRSVEERKDPGG